MTTSRNDQLFTRAQATIPGGVNSPVRAFKAVGGTPRFFAKGAGPFFWDADGKRYIDYVGSWGPLILGHAHPAVVRAVTERAQDGLSFGAPTEIEIELAELLCKSVPGIEMVRLVSSGTEATMTAMRLARGFTGRHRIIKFEGCYHGHADALLVKAGSGAAHVRHALVGRRAAGDRGHTMVLSYNDCEELAATFAKMGSEIAAVIVEPVAGNMNLVPGTPRFLGLLRELCTQHGAVLIFDEVMTGFRVGAQGAQGRLRHHRGPDHPGQGDRRRHAGRRVRRPPRHHGVHRAARARLSGRHAVGQSGRGRRGPRDAAPRARTGLLRRARRAHAPAGRRPQCGGRSARAWHSAPRRWAACSASTSARRRRRVTPR